MMRYIKRASYIAGVAGVFLGATSTQAAYRMHQRVFPFSYAIESIQDSQTGHMIEFDIPGHNEAALGDLEELGYDFGHDYVGGSLDWTITNTGDDTLDVEPQRTAHQSSLTVKSSDNVLTGSTGYRYSNAATLGPGQSFIFHQAVSGGGGGGVTWDPGEMADFRTAENVTLVAESSLQGDNRHPPIEFTDVTGQMDVQYEVRIWYKYDAHAAPDSTPIAVGESADAVFDDQGFAWYRLEHDGGPLSIDTFGSDIDEYNDTMLGLYNSLGGFVDANDNADPDNENYLSRLEFDDGELGEGTYYIIVSGYGIDFWSDQTNFNADPGDLDITTGSYRVNVVPEPAAMSLLAVSGLALLARRRR